MDDLISSYRGSLKIVRKLHKDCKLDGDKKILSSSISDLEYCIEWMETARMPGAKRGIERRSYKQREVLMDPKTMAEYLQQKQHPQYNTVSDSDFKKLNDILSCLSEFQRDCYTLIRGQCFTYQQTADFLQVSISSVLSHMQRADKLIRDKLANNGEVPPPKKQKRVMIKKEKQKEISLTYLADLEDEQEPIQKILMKEIDVLSHFHIKKNELKKLIENEQLPTMKVGRKLFFWKHEIENWERNRQQKIL